MSFARASSHPARGFSPPSHGCRPASYCSLHDSSVCPREIQALGVSQCRGIWKSRHNYQSSAIEQVLGLRKSLCSCLPRKPRYSHSLRITAISYGPCYIYHIHDDRATMPSTIMVSSCRLFDATGLSYLYTNITLSHKENIITHYRGGKTNPSTHPL